MKTNLDTTKAMIQSAIESAKAAPLSHQQLQAVAELMDRYSTVCCEKMQQFTLASLPVQTAEVAA